MKYSQGGSSDGCDSPYLGEGADVPSPTPAILGAANEA
jgi:hypothetical protein